jgi:hypothetical protein
MLSRRYFFGSMDTYQKLRCYSTSGFRENSRAIFPCAHESAHIHGWCASKITTRDQLHPILQLSAFFLHIECTNPTFPHNTLKSQINGSGLQVSTLCVTYDTLKFTQFHWSTIFSPTYILYHLLRNTSYSTACYRLFEILNSNFETFQL